MTVCLLMLAGCAAEEQILKGEVGLDNIPVESTDDSHSSDVGTDTEAVLDTEADTEVQEPSEDTALDEVTDESTADDTEADTEPEETTAETTAETTFESVADTIAETEAVWHELEKMTLEDVSYTFELDMQIIDLNPGAVGAMTVKGFVTAPVVRDVMIASWGQNISSWSAKTIYEEALFYTQIWKNEGLPIVPDFGMPLEVWTSHPVFTEELGSYCEVLLIGFDGEYNPVAYAIVAGEIPGAR